MLVRQDGSPGRWVPACAVTTRKYGQSVGLAPLLLPLPPPDAAHANVADPEVEFLDVFVALQALGAAVQHDAPAVEHVAEIGDVERHLRVLLDQQHGRPA